MFLEKQPLELKTNQRQTFQPKKTNFIFIFFVSFSIFSIIVFNTLFKISMFYNSIDYFNNLSITI